MFNIGTLGHWRKQWQSYMEGPSRGMATIWKGLPIWGFMKRSYCRSDHGGILGGWGPSLRPKNGRWPQFRYQWPLNQDVCDMVLKVWSQANHNIPGSTKKNSHPMKYHRTTEVMSPPSPNSMLSSEFCVWRPSKETAIFCSWCSALPIATLKLGVAGVSKVSPWFHVDGCFFEEPGITTVMDIHCMCVICCVSFQHVHQTWSNVSDSNVVFAHDWYSLVDFHIFSPATTQHIFFQRHHLTTYPGPTWAAAPEITRGLDVDSQLCLVHFKGRPSPVEVPVRHLRGLAAPKERLFPTGRSTILMGNLWGINMDMYILM